MKLLTETWLVYQRAMIRTFQSFRGVVVMTVQPLFFLILFAPLLKSSLRGADPDKVLNLYVPGLLVQLAIFTCLYACFSLVAETHFGVLERFQVTPVSRFALLLGRTMRDASVLLMQCVMITLPAVAFGLHLYPLQVLQMAGLLLLLALGIAPLSYALALIFKTNEVLGPGVSLITMPLTLLSGIFVPMTYAPDWLRWLSLANPLTTVVEGARELYAGHAWNSGVAWAYGLAVVGAVVSLTYTGRLFARTAE
ncbi:ABC transporter permease [Micromonospora sp. NPDC049171]|uniref:ABC transporter permease n=1 Tax=Micromonospora sp. NPDC049171 TaxID=3155770 RepID=UPI0033F07BDC